MDPLPSSGGGGASLSYPDSLDSSPRSRGGESWDEPFPAAAAAAKLRFMCSFGGRIVPRPTDKSLCYLGGETRMVVVDRHASLADLSARLSRTLLAGRPFTLKYQIPNEDLDSLISVTTDEDLENMIEEYDRVAAAAPTTGSSRSTRLRLFLFPTKSESAPSSISSLLDDSKSETWFVDALNGAMGMVSMDGIPRGLSSDAASVNCLLGLEDNSTSPTVVHPSDLLRPDSSGKIARQDVHSVPDSPMLDTTSSFGSTSSAPSLSNLPPIRVRPEDRPPDQRIAGLDEQFTHMNTSAATSAGQEMLKEMGFAPQHPAPPPIVPVSTVSASTPNISPTENPSRVFASDEDKKLPPPPSLLQKPTPVDAPIVDPVSRPMNYQDRSSPVAASVPVSDQSYRGGYLMPQMQQDQLQQQQHYHQTQQQQFIHPSSHYIHQATGQVLPVPPYYQMPHPLQPTQQSHPYDPQLPMYFLPVRSNSPYNLAPLQPNMGDPAASATAIPNSAVKPGAPLSKVAARVDLPANPYRTAAAPSPAIAMQAAPAPQPLIHLAADQGHPYAGMGFHLMHHHHPSQSPAAMANYGYEYPDPSHQPQVYYTQTTSPPSMAPQYQTTVSPIPDAGAAVAPQLQQGEMKQTRAA